MNHEKIGVIQIVFILMMSVGLMNHVMVIPLLLDRVGRDAWITVALTGMTYLLWVPLLYYVMRRTGQRHIVDWLKECYGNGVAWTAAALFALFVFTLAAITLRDTTTWTVVSYMPQTPPVVLSLVWISLCTVAACMGIRTIAITAGILLPFVVLFGYFVAIANLEHKDYSNVLPLLERGWSPVLQGMIYAGGGLFELIVVLLFQHRVSKRVPLWVLLVLAVILIGLIMGPLLGSIAEFGPEDAAKQRYPAFEQWRLVKIGKYIEHLDFLSIYQWLSGSFIRISTMMALMIELFRIRQLKNKIYVLTIAGIVMLIFDSMNFSDMIFYELLKYYYFPFALLFSIVLSLLLASLAVFKSGRRENA